MNFYVLNHVTRNIYVLFLPRCVCRSSPRISTRLFPTKLPPIDYACKSVWYVGLDTVNVLVGNSQINLCSILYGRSQSNFPSLNNSFSDLEVFAYLEILEKPGNFVESCSESERFPKNFKTRKSYLTDGLV